MPAKLCIMFQGRAESIGDGVILQMVWPSPRPGAFAGGGLTGHCSRKSIQGAELTMWGEEAQAPIDPQDDAIA